MLDNKDVCCFFVTKHSWKGKYKRIFSVGTRGITTYNPTTLENTNQVSSGQTTRQYSILSVKLISSLYFLVGLQWVQWHSTVLQISGQHRVCDQHQEGQKSRQHEVLIRPSSRYFDRIPSLFEQLLWAIRTEQKLQCL